MICPGRARWAWPGLLPWAPPPKGDSSMPFSRKSSRVPSQGAHADVSHPPKKEREIVWGPPQTRPPHSPDSASIAIGPLTRQKLGRPEGLTGTSRMGGRIAVSRSQHHGLPTGMGFYPHVIYPSFNPHLLWIQMGYVSPLWPFWQADGVTSELRMTQRVSTFPLPQSV